MCRENGSRAWLIPLEVETMSISFATFNLENLQIAGAATYPGSTPLTPAEFKRRSGWTASQLAEIDADRESLPPAARGAIAWRTAFSTSGWRQNAGTC